jgi:hypothetical protein
MEKFFGKENINWRIEKGEHNGATTDFYIVINEKTT